MSTPTLEGLAARLGVSVEALEALNITRQGDRWRIPERNAQGEIIGYATRDDDGGKGFVKGGHRGLTLGWPLPPYAGTSPAEPILVAEGMSCTAAGLTLGFTTIGRPSATGGAEHLRALLADRYVCIVAENDPAGIAGADKIAAALAGVARDVRGVIPPEGVKDLRAWLQAGLTREELVAKWRAAETIGPGSPPSAAANPMPPCIVRLSDVKPEPVSWLWPGRFALGKLTLIAGDPGLGKSFLTLDMAARVSRGTPWPDAPDKPQTPGGVVLLSAEDDAADTIRPRLDAARADVDRIVALQAVPIISDRGKPAGVRMFDLTRDLPALVEAIGAAEDCRLVVIDPVTAYLGGVDSHKNAEIRGLLAPLGEIAARHRVAVVAVTHLNKSAGGAAIYRAMGSLAFTAAARAAWAVTKDENDPRRRLLLSIKNNLAPDTGGLAYSLVAVEGHEAAAVAWEPDPVHVTADDALGGERPESGGGALDEATDWLRDTLVGGPVPAADVKAAAKRDGIAARTLDRAKSALGVRATREGYASDGRWVWAMPLRAPWHGAATPSTSQAMAHNDDSGALCDPEAGRGVSDLAHYGPDPIERHGREIGGGA